MDDASFGRWLSGRRRSLGLTRVELARRVSCAIVTLRKIEEDARRPSHELAFRLADQLQVRLDARERFVQVARGERSVDWLIPTDGPEPAAQPSTPSAPPIPLTPLIGRERDLAALRALLENPACRLITILGSGGIGKTRLALAVAAEHVQAFDDGVVFVSLVAVGTVAHVVPAILTAIGVGMQGQRDPRAQLLTVLREKELLLVLDNLEQLLALDGGREDLTTLLEDLLIHAQRVTLLVTSRERLGIPGEWLYDLSGLSYPLDASDQYLEHYGAVQLFVQRAQQVRRQFALTEDEIPAVMRICRQVEGLPLAIELAAANVRSRSCAQIAAAIETSLSALAGSLRALPERHRSMYVTFEHSWQLLSDVERGAFARLSVFRGGFTEQAAADVACAPPELLAILVDKSLLRWDGVRYSLHELLRQYAAQKLEQMDEGDALRRKHALYYLNVTLVVQSTARGRYSAGLDVLEQEHDNLRAALTWTLECEDLTTGARLAWALATFWEVRGHWKEASNWTELLLARSRGHVAPTTVVELLRQAAHLRRRQGDYRAAMVLCEEELALCRELDDQPGVATALRGLARLAWAEEEHARATALYQQALALCREIDDRLGMVDCFCRLGQLAQEQGDDPRARQWFEECLRLCRSLNNRDAAAALQLLGSSWRRNYERATALLEESLVLFREVDDAEGIADSLRYLGELAYMHGDCQRAAARYTESLALYERSGDPHGIAMILLDQGAIAHIRGDDDQAISLYAESLRRHQQLGNAWGVATLLWRLGGVALRQSDRIRALTYTADSLRLFGELKDMEGIGNCLLVLASVAIQQEQPERAVHLLGAASMLAPVPRAFSLEEGAEERQNLAMAQAQLGDTTFAAAWAVGKALTLDEVMAKALEIARLIAL